MLKLFLINNHAVLHIVGKVSIVVSLNEQRIIIDSVDFFRFIILWKTDVKNEQ